MAYIENLEDKPDIVVFLDGDYSDHPDEMPMIVEPIIKNDKQLVIGSRALGNLEKGAMQPQQIFGNWLATSLIKLIYGYEFTDLGPFRAVKYNALLNLNMQDANFGWTVEMQVKAAKQKLIEHIQENDQFKLKAISESTYYENQKSSAIAIKVVAYIIASFLTVGAMFAAANTMYAAVSNRGREIGTLRAVGFPRRAILTSFVLESLVLCALGGILGCLATIPLNGLSGGTSIGFSEITFDFRFGPNVLIQGMTLAILMGLIGGLFPALRAIRLQITEALRQR